MAVRSAQRHRVVNGASVDEEGAISVHDHHLASGHRGLCLDVTLAPLYGTRRAAKILSRSLPPEPVFRSWLLNCWMEQLMDSRRPAGVRRRDELHDSIQYLFCPDLRRGRRRTRGTNVPLTQFSPIGSSRGSKWPTTNDSSRNDKTPADWGFYFVKIDQNVYRVRGTRTSRLSRNPLRRPEPSDKLPHRVFATKITICPPW